MKTVINSNYAGFQPDELPNGLDDSSLTGSIELFFTKGGQGVRVAWDGSLVEMGCLAKVVFFILDFFGLSTASRAENVQYQFVRILYLASSRDLVKGKLDKMIETTDVDGLLMGVGEAIAHRHSLPSLQSSLIKFTQNHDVNPGVPFRIGTTFPRTLLQEPEDWGMTFLCYADSFHLPCTFLIEPEVVHALEIMNAHPSEKFCIKFVEVLRKQPQLFEDYEFSKEEQLKIDCILKTAARAFASRKRYPEAIAAIEELRPRLLEEETFTISDQMYLALLYSIYRPKKLGDLLNRTDFSQFPSALTRKELETLLMNLLELEDSLEISHKMKLILLCSYTAPQQLDQLFLRTKFNQFADCTNLSEQEKGALAILLLEFLNGIYSRELAETLHLDASVRPSFDLLAHGCPTRLSDVLLRLAEQSQGLTITIADLINVMTLIQNHHGKEHPGYRALGEAACHRLNQCQPPEIRGSLFAACGNDPQRVEQFLTSLRELGYPEDAARFFMAGAA